MLFIFIILLILLILLVILLIKNNREYLNSNPFDELDAVIYINLENRQDRKDLLLKELEKINVPPTKIHKVSGIYIPKNGHKGCVQSHIIALNLIKLNNWNKVLILEDDAELNVEPEEFKKQISQMLKYMNKNKWDIIMLAMANETKLDIPNETNIKKIKSATTSSSYIVNKNYIDNLLYLFNYLNTMMSNDKWTNKGNERFALDQSWKDLQEKDIWLGFKTNLIKQRNIKSSINEFM